MLLRKVFLMGNLACLLYFLRKYDYQLMLRKRKISLKCKNIIMKNPELLNYFGAINTITITNLHENRLSRHDLDFLNNAEFLIEGTKRMGKISIRYFIKDISNLREFIKIQNENYQNILSKQNSNKNDIFNKDLHDFNYLNILKRNSSSDDSKDKINESLNNNDLESAINNQKPLKKKKNLKLFNKEFNFYHENQTDSIYNTILFNFKTNYMKNFYKSFFIQRRCLQYDNTYFKEDNIDSLRKYYFYQIFNIYLNHIDIKLKAEEKGIFIDDIYIKKNNKYYSITPQNYDKEEYKKENTKYMKNDYIDEKYFSREKDNFFYKVVLDSIRETSNINSYYYYIPYDFKKLKYSKKLQKKNEDNFEYNYPFLEELYDHISNDWRLKYILYSFFILTFIGTSYIYILSNNHYHIAKVDDIGRTVINLRKKNGKFLYAPYYYSIYPNFLSLNRSSKFLFIQPALNYKIVSLCFIKTYAEKFDINSKNTTDNYTKL